ncbi:hypothetical protein PIB30_062442 [Stylosanthes scabra]|uniref:Uncharacterized protein n=1 Tax=Stylosanthes scabra TaxID=79078 RepID=A0ABU6QLL5_9FABA|nr:hypothetical protein [Stylosanthes scabra]
MITLTHIYYLIRSGALAGGSSKTQQGFRASSTRPIGPLTASIWTKRLLHKIGFCNLMSWKNSDLKLTTTPKSTRKRPRSGMTRKSKGECLNQVSPYGHAEIQDDKDGTKFVVNGQRLKQYLSEEWNLHQPIPPQH